MNQTELRLRATELGRQSEDPWTKVFARWLAQARPDQLAPPHPWLVWFLMGGRGAGKTRTGAEHVTRRLVRDGYRRWGCIARTAHHIRDEVVEGPAGLLACAPPNARPRYEPSKLRVVYPNGAVAFLYSAEEPDALRGPEHDGLWCDELAAWKDAHKGDVVDTTWNNAMLGLRSGARPEVVVTSTPRRVKLVRELVKRPTTLLTNATTYANLANLTPTFRDVILQSYEGTRLGRQELMGQLLEDVEGALWTEPAIQHAPVPDLSRVVVAVDPSGSARGDEVGIVVAGRSGQQGYVLADYSGHMSPDAWGRRAVRALHGHRADRIVAESNFGGEMVLLTIRTVDQSAPVTLVHASRGKMVRAEPVAALYEQRRIFHTAPFPELEEQMLTWTQDNPVSPGRMDALVWALTDLLVETIEGPGTTNVGFLTSHWA